jgi:hypothetical protein
MLQLRLRGRRGTRVIAPHDVCAAYLSMMDELSGRALAAEVSERDWDGGVAT